MLTEKTPAEMVAHYEEQLRKLDAVTPENAHELMAGSKMTLCRRCYKPTPVEDLKIQLNGDVLEVRWTCCHRKCHTHNVGDFPLSAARELLQAGLSGAQRRTELAKN